MSSKKLTRQEERGSDYTFGQILRGIRTKDRDITQEKLANLINKSRNTVSAWERGDYVPDTIDDVHAIISALNPSQHETKELLQAFSRQSSKTIYHEGNQESVEKQTEQRLFATPFQLPQQTVYFSGREKELEWIFENLQPHRILTICGPAGIGKTCLIAEAIGILDKNGKLANKFRDGVVTFSFQDQPDALLALEHIVRSYSDEAKPTALDAVRRLLAKRQVLLILDSVEKVENLDLVLSVHGTATVVVISQQRELLTDHRYWLEVSPLSMSQAVQVLMSWGGSRITNAIVVRKICSILGRHPLALRLAGSYIASNKINDSEYLEWLTETPLTALSFGKRTHESIPLLIERSMESLSDEAKHVLAVVALLGRASFTRELISAAIGMSIGQTVKALGELVNLSMLGRKKQLFHISHALLGIYAKALIPVNAETLNRLVTYVVEVIQSHTVSKQQTDFEFHPIQLLSIVRECERQELWLQVTQSFNVIDSFLELKGYWIDRLSAAKINLRVARQLANKGLLAKALIAIGSANYKLGDWESASQYYAEGLRISREHRDLFNEATSLTRLAEVALVQGRWDESVRFHEVSIELFDRLQNRLEAGKVRLALAWVLGRQGNWSSAINQGLLGLAVGREASDPDVEMEALAVLGAVNTRMSKWNESTRYLQDGLEIAQQRKDRNSESSFLQMLGKTYKNMGRFEDALKLLRKSLQIKQQLHNRYDTAETLNMLAMTYGHMEKWATAERIYRKSLILFLELGEQNGISAVKANLATLYRKTNKLKKAVSMYKEVIPVFVGLGERQGVGKIHGNLAETYELLGRYEEASIHYAECVAIFMELNDNENWGIALAKWGRIFDKLGDSAEAINRWQESLLKLNADSPKRNEITEWLRAKEVTSA